MILDLDKAIDIYQAAKRDKNITYVYDSELDKFILQKTKPIPNTIPFINSFDECRRIIDIYLEQDYISKYKEDCKNAIREDKYHNKIVSFLWFFEHIDGCFDFNNYECIEICKVIKKWCKRNKIEFNPPSINVPYKY